MTIERYSKGAMILHWVIAFLLAFQLGLGWRMMGMAPGSGMFAAFQFHKSLGILILLFSLARLGLRFAKPRPPEVDAGVLGRWLSRGVHTLLYGFMIGGPLTGWAVVSTARMSVPTKLFGLIPWPHLPLGQHWHNIAEALHGQIAWLGVALVALHFAGALRHHLGADRRNVLGRMLPGLSDEAKASAGRSFGLAAMAATALIICFAVPWLARSANSSTPAAAPLPRPGLAETFRAVDAAVPAAQPVKSAEAPPPAAPSHWDVIPGGRLGFTARMNGAAIVGRFERWSANIQFDPEALDDSRIMVKVGLLSADTSDGSRDEMLKGADFFGTAGSQAMYLSRSIRKVGKDRYRVDGALTMNGKSLPVPVSFALSIAGDHATVSGQAPLDRTAFGIGRGEWAATDQIAAGVDVSFSFQARRAR